MTSPKIARHSTISSCLCYVIMPKLVSSFPLLSFFFGGEEGCRKNSGCLRGAGSEKNEGIPGGVYKLHIWTITNSSGPLCGKYI